MSIDVIQIWELLCIENIEGTPLQIQYMMNPKKTNESKEFWISNDDNFWSMRAMKKS